MLRISTFLVLLLAALPARAADLCAQVAGGAPLVPVPQAAFPADVKPFVIADDPTFQDQLIELYPLGKTGAGLAVHYEGTLAEQYLAAFDRVNGKLKSVAVPNLNSETDDYFEAHLATVNGAPVLFGTHEADGKTLVRLAPWTGHQFGPICEAGAK
jgi:hypothetical protein